MELFQILDCSSLGTCCTDYELMSILDITRKIFNLIQFIVPILLIVMSTVQFTQLMMNPELKGGMKKILNKFIAAVFIFMLPVLVDAFLGIAPNSISVAACWEAAKVSSEVSHSQNYDYIDLDDGREKIGFLVSPSKYAKGNTKATPTPGASGPNQGSVNAGIGEGSLTGNQIVAYAEKYVGKSYVWGGEWNGEDPYVPTDCSGFVKGVYAHYGISLPHNTAMMWNATDKYTLVTSGNIKAGDLVMYNGHVGILTGNGREIIHAKGAQWGVVKDNDYTTSSSKSILGIMRINGIN